MKYATCNAKWMDFVLKTAFFASNCGISRQIQEFRVKNGVFCFKSRDFVLKSNVFCVVGLSCDDKSGDLCFKIGISKAAGGIYTTIMSYLAVLAEGIDRIMERWSVAPCLLRTRRIRNEQKK